MKSVAEIMYENAPVLQLDPDKAYVTGLMHDVGYIKTKIGHEEMGAALLESMGLSKEYADAIRYHSTSGYDLIKKGIEITPMMLLLQYADMTVDKTGEKIGYAGRLEDIGKRYGWHDIAYINARNTVDFLKKVFEVKYGEIQPVSRKEFDMRINQIKQEMLEELDR